jgi:hypothetical protein
MPRMGRKRDRPVDDDDDEVLVRVPVPSSARQSSRQSSPSAGSSSAGNAHRTGDERTDSGEVAVTVDSDEGTPACEVRHRSSRSRAGALTLPSFSGTGDSLAVHLARWRNCSAFYGWDEVARVCHLKGSLSGVAANLLWQLPEPCSEAEILQLLQARFGDEGRLETYRSQLRTRRRRKGESLQSLYLDVSRLVSLAYPSEGGKYMGVCARDAFLAALNDDEIRFRVLDRGAENLEQAYEIATKYESLLGGRYARDGDALDQQRVRHVEKHSSAEAWQGELVRQMQGLEAAFKSEVSRMESAWGQRLQSLERACASRSDGKGSAVGPPPSAANFRGDSRPFRTARRGMASQQRSCFQCGGFGHFRRDCPQLSAPTSSLGSGNVPQQPPGETTTRGVVHVVTEDDMVDRTESCLPIRIRRGNKYTNLFAILDTGSHSCVLPASMAGNCLKPCNTKLVAANGSEISVLGQKEIEVWIDGRPFKTLFVVSDQVSEVLLSRVWLRQNGFVWDFGNEIRLGDRKIQLKPRTCSDFVRRIVASEEAVLQPRSLTGLRVNAQVSSLRGPSSDFCVESCAVNDKVFVPRTVISKEPSGFVFACNPTDEPVRIKRGQFVAMAQRIDGNSIRSIACASGNPPQGKVETRVDGTELSDQFKQLVQPLIDGLPSEFSAAEVESIRDLLYRYKDIFSMHDLDVGCCTLGECKLELKDPSLPPVCQSLRAHPVRHLDLIDAEISRLLEAGIIRESFSEWNQNVVLIAKKPISEGDLPRYRVTVDMRKVNDRLIRKVWPMPSADLVFNTLKNHRYYCGLDLCNAFLSVNLEEQSRHLTAFSTRRGQFEFTRMSPGLHLAPSVFNRLVMGKLLNGLLWREVSCFIDDLVIPCHNVAEGIRVLDVVFSRIRQSGMKIKVQKCQLFKSSVRVLGFIVSQRGISEDPDRTRAIQELKFPTTARGLRSVLGACGFSRRFYKNYAEITAPLTDQLRKGAKVSPTPEALAAFQRLKDCMSKPPVLCFFDPNAAEHILESDSSGRAYGSCLYQREADGELRIVAYHSGKFAESERHACVTKLELAGIIKSLKHFKPLLLSGPVTVRSDHSCLRYLLTSKELLPQFQRYVDFIAQFDLKVEYTPGKKQLVSDCLSRAEYTDSCRPCETAGQLCRCCRTKEELRRKPRVAASRRGELSARLAASANCNGQRAEVANSGGQREPVGSACSLPLGDVFAQRGGRSIQASSQQWRRAREHSLEEGRRGVGGRVRSPVAVNLAHGTGQPLSGAAVSNGLVRAGERGSLLGGDAGEPERVTRESEAGQSAWSCEELTSSNVLARAEESESGQPLLTVEAGASPTVESGAGQPLPTVGDGQGRGQPSIGGNQGADLGACRANLFTGPDESVENCLSVDPPLGGDNVSSVGAGEQDEGCSVAVGPLSQSIGRVQTRGQFKARAEGRPRAAGNRAHARSAQDGWFAPLVSIDEVREAQAVDPHIPLVIAALQSGNLSNDVKYMPVREMQCYVRQLDSLFVEDGVLYRNFVNPDLSTKFKQVVVPLSLREVFMQAVHVQLLCHTRMQQKNEAMLARHGFWPRWKTDLRVFLKQCQTCLERHVGKLPRHGLLRPSGGRICGPGEVACVDLFGPLPSSFGYKYCLSFQDLFSRFLVLVPLQDKSAPRVARAILKIMLQWGFYPILRSDVGGEFVADVCKELFALVGVQRHLNFSYRPQSNAVERTHRVLGHFFSTILSKHTDWVKFLDIVSSAYNGIPHKATGFFTKSHSFGS